MHAIFQLENRAIFQFKNVERLATFKLGVAKIYTICQIGNMEMHAILQFGSTEKQACLS